MDGPSRASIYGWLPFGLCAFCLWEFNTDASGAGKISAFGERHFKYTKNYEAYTSYRKKLQFFWFKKNSNRNLECMKSSGHAKTFKPKILP